MLVPASEDYDLAAWDFDLPRELIAQHPPECRGASRLMVLRGNEPIKHEIFANLPRLLPASTLLIANNSKVFPARLPMLRPGGGKAELLLLTPPTLLKIDRINSDSYAANAEGLIRPAAKIHLNQTLTSAGLKATILTKGEFGRCTVRLTWKGELNEILAKVGRLPLPPYIKSSPGPEELDRYQTTYASRIGSVAAPTAGLHFTSLLQNELVACGHDWLELTLHVGYGTFSPVRSSDIRNHKMHEEYVEISEDTVAAIRQAKADKRPIIAVGTTATRALEGVAQLLGELAPYSGPINTFIYPGYKFGVIDGLVTNFHLPGSTLLMLVAALAGRERTLAAYREAIAANYRFFSWGDAMLIYGMGDRFYEK